MTSRFDTFVYSILHESNNDASEIENDIELEVWDIGLVYDSIKDLLNGSEYPITYILNPTTNSQLYNDHRWLLKNDYVSIRTKKRLLLNGDAWARFMSLGGGEGTIYIDHVTLENIYESNDIDYFKKLKHYILHEVGHAVQAFERDIRYNEKYLDIEDDYDANEDDAEEFAAMYLNNIDTY
jgi:hypothetical protein